MKRTILALFVFIIYDVGDILLLARRILVEIIKTLNDE